MPTYKFKDTNTGKVFDEFMSFSERETYLKSHSNITQVPVMFAYTGDRGSSLRDHGPSSKN